MIGFRLFPLLFGGVLCDGEKNLAIYTSWTILSMSPKGASHITRRE